MNVLLQKPQSIYIIKNVYEKKLSYNLLIEKKLKFSEEKKTKKINQFYCYCWSNLSKNILKYDKIVFQL